MISRLTLVLAALGATLTAACGDAVAPPSPGAVALSLSEGPKSWQCATATGVAAVEVAEGASDATVVEAPEGQVVTQVGVKVGTECWPTPDGATGTYTIFLEGEPCALVEGLGTRVVTVTRTGTSPTCKNVTHVEYVSAPPPVGDGQLRICTEIPYNPNPEGFLFEPITYLVAGTLVTPPVKLYPERPDLLTCAEPIELPAGEYAVTEQPTINFASVAAIATDPEDRSVAFDPATRTATVRVVGGTTTTVTFIGGWGDHFD